MTILRDLVTQLWREQLYLLGVYYIMLQIIAMQWKCIGMNGMQDKVPYPTSWHWKAQIRHRFRAIEPQSPLFVDIFFCGHWTLLSDSENAQKTIVSSFETRSWNTVPFFVVCSRWLSVINAENNLLPWCLFVLRFYSPDNPKESCRVRSVYLATFTGQAVL